MNTVIVAQITPNTVSRIPPARNKWTKLPRTDVVELALKEISERNNFATPAMVEAYLDEHARHETRDDVSTALSYLKKHSKAHTVGRAQWVIGAERLSATEEVS